MKNTTENIVDLSKLLTKEHEQKWVALSRDNKTIVGFGDDLVALDKQIGDKDVIFMKVPPSNVYLSF